MAKSSLVYRAWFAPTELQLSLSFNSITTLSQPLLPRALTLAKNRSTYQVIARAGFILVTILLIANLKMTFNR